MKTYYISVTNLIVVESDENGPNGVLTQSEAEKIALKEFLEMAQRGNLNFDVQTSSHV